MKKHNFKGIAEEVKTKILTDNRITISEELFFLYICYSASGEIKPEFFDKIDPDEPPYKDSHLI